MELYQFKLQTKMQIFLPDLESSATSGTATRKATPWSPDAIWNSNLTISMLLLVKYSLL